MSYCRKYIVGLQLTHARHYARLIIYKHGTSRDLVTAHGGRRHGHGPTARRPAPGGRDGRSRGHGQRRGDRQSQRALGPESSGADPFSQPPGVRSDAAKHREGGGAEVSGGRPRLSADGSQKSSDSDRSAPSRSTSSDCASSSSSSPAASVSVWSAASDSYFKSASCSSKPVGSWIYERQQKRRKSSVEQQRGEIAQLACRLSALFGFQWLYSMLRPQDNT